MPSVWQTIGEYAPVKKAEKVEVIDYDKLTELVNFYENKYGANLRRLIIDEEGDAGVVSEEDQKIINQLEFASLEKNSVPKKQITVYI